MIVFLLHSEVTKCSFHWVPNAVTDQQIIGRQCITQRKKRNSNLLWRWQFGNIISYQCAINVLCSSSCDYFILRVIPAPTISASPGNVLEMQILRPTARLLVDSDAFWNACSPKATLSTHIWFYPCVSSISRISHSLSFSEGRAAPPCNNWCRR